MEEKTIDRRELMALLEYYAAAGVDCALEETPQNRFAEAANARAKRLQAFAQPTSPQQRPAPPAARPAKTVDSIPPDISKAPGRVPDVAAADDARTLAESTETLDSLKEALARFDGCNLKRTAKNLVFGDGNTEADVMFIGEAPGRDEDIQGLPFVGRSGVLLNKMLAAIGLERGKDVYITNVIPWRPPGNRTPTPQETALCRPFLDRHIALISPRVIVTLGGAATMQILETTQGIMSLRGKVTRRDIAGLSIDILPTLHPAYLLRQPLQKRLAWQDLLALKKLIDNANGHD